VARIRAKLYERGKDFFSSQAFTPGEVEPMIYVTSFRRFFLFWL